MVITSIYRYSVSACELNVINCGHSLFSYALFCFPYICFVSENGNICHLRYPITSITKERLCGRDPANRTRV